MKIAILVTEFPKLSETFILNQITDLLEKGHEVTIFALCASHENKIHSDVKKYNLLQLTSYINIPAKRIDRFIKAIFLVISNFHKGPIKILKSINIFKYREEAFSLNLLYYLITFLGSEFDIIHSHFGPNGIIGAYLKEIGIPGKYLTNFHGYDVNSYPRIKGEDTYKNLFKVGDIFFANTNFTKQRLIQLGCIDSKIIILPVGLNLDRYKFIDRERQRNQPLTILSVGRLVEKKGHEYAIKAIKKIINLNKDIVYYIAGNGPMKKTLEKLIADLEITSYVKLLGAAEQNEVYDLYKKSDIFVLPSITASDGDCEGQALVIQEAQATGLPVISTFHNGIPEGLLDGVSGFLVNEKDVDALAERITYLIDHPEMRQKMGVEGRHFVESNYDIKLLNQKLICVYEKVLKR